MSGLYRAYAEAALSQETDHPSHVEPLNDNLILLLCTSGYVADLAAHQFIDDLGANVVARSSPLTGVTITDGVLNFTGTTIPSVPANTETQIILAKYTGNDTNSPLMVWVNAASGLPNTSNGGDIDIDPSSGAYKAFSF